MDAYFGLTDTDGIETIDNGQLIMDNEGVAIYNLAGQMVNGQWSMVNDKLPKGIYIQSGKKVFIQQ